MQAQSPLIPGVDMAKRYKAAVRLPDGTDVRVYSTREHPSSCHGQQVWCDRDGNAYGQINLRNPLHIVHAVEEIDEDEAAIFDGYVSHREGARRGGQSTSEAKRAASRANGRKGGRPRLYPCDGETLTEEEIESRLAAANYRDEYCRFEQSIRPLEFLGVNCRGCQYKRRCRAWPTIRERD